MVLLCVYWTVSVFCHKLRWELKMGAVSHSPCLPNAWSVAYSGHSRGCWRVDHLGWLSLPSPWALPPPPAIRADVCNLLDTR